MTKALVKLEYRQVIDSSSAGDFERKVFSHSYSEFCMQAQAYNPENKLRTLQELVTNNPKANSLHYKVGFAIDLYVKELNSVIPGLEDSLGRSNFRFASHRFEILESDVTNKLAHRVAITYRTDVLTLFGVMGEYLLLTVGDKQNEVEEEIETFMLKTQPNLSIVGWQEKLQALLARESD